MGNIYTQSILDVNKHKITQDGQHIYTINTRCEQAQNNSRWETYIHNQYLAWTNTKRRATHIQNQKLVMNSHRVADIYSRVRQKSWQCRRKQNICVKSNRSIIIWDMDNQIVMANVDFLLRWLQPKSNVAFASAAELCPEIQCIGHKL